LFLFLVRFVFGQFNLLKTAHTLSIWGIPFEQDFASVSIDERVCQAHISCIDKSFHIVKAVAINIEVVLVFLLADGILALVGLNVA
jgi:hypothetical protein